MRKGTVISLLLLAGCATSSTLRTRQEIDQIRHYRTLGQLYYAGSSGPTNYFVKFEFLHPTRRYTCSQDIFPIQNRFPKTDDRGRWVPYLVSLSKGTEGFVGEPQEKIENGSPNHVPEDTARKIADPQH